MKKFIFFFALFFISIGSYANSAPAELTRLLTGYSTYTAQFTQSTIDGNGRKLQTSYGQVYIKRPGQFRWEELKPMKQIVIANGNTLWIYDVALAQVTQRTMKNNKGVNPAALLSGHVSDLQAKFTIEKIKKEGNSIYFRLTPKQKNSVFKKVIMQFVDNKLRGLTVANNLDQTNIFAFKDVKINNELSSSLFNFKPPAGVDVLKQ